MFCMFYMVYHLYISNAPAPKTVHSKSNTTTKIAAPNFMRVFYHKSPPYAYPPTTGGRSREAYPPTEGRCRRQSLEWWRYAGCKSATGS